jgi:hypothetical protein
LILLLLSLSLSLLLLLFVGNAATRWIRDVKINWNRTGLP